MVWSIKFPGKPTICVTAQKAQLVRAKHQQAKQAKEEEGATSSNHKTPRVDTSQHIQAAKHTNQHQPPPSLPTTTPATMSKTISYAEVAKHNTNESCYMVIHDKVYDVTKFLIEHPGGEEVMMDYAGKDASEGFEDVGHSEDAREQLSDFVIGELPADEKGQAATESNIAPQAPSRAQASSDGSWFLYVALAAVVAGAGVAYFYFNK
ncbi:cytochrome b5 type B [Salpingoeca rosetta]|uniref:Cytochrome b5 type B n=1 Tax=Salpingoeca rosetta (strain ATCC 50818 / BSB-021) TaxID=946362 RepID=F2U101_SALR5|nr:cytochrome b5 type B [Salpingoeca rosetta]EGD80575.1 cytochrome b5 type B [Salpingoeca rosetta]|eukprot:XP_004997136.1 cytochrome b5 type B [Salpingoeca rosetta]